VKYKARGDFSAIIPPGVTLQDIHAGEVYDLPDTQDATPSGPPITWSPEHWEPVTDKPAAKAKDKES
jgi:hypothetical protein